MALKLDLQTQGAALMAYEAQDYERAIEIYQSIARTSKIHFNVGVIYATIGRHRQAILSFQRATNLDPYLAVGHFQCGVSYFLLKDFQPALMAFENALLYLRGNEDIVHQLRHFFMALSPLLPLFQLFFVSYTYIRHSPVDESFTCLIDLCTIVYSEYQQLGLKFRLHAAQCLFNIGLCNIQLDQKRTGMRHLRTARRIATAVDHDVIEEAIEDSGKDYTVFSIPVGVLFRPSPTAIQNALQTKPDFLGESELVAVTSLPEAYTGFSGATRASQGRLPRTGAKPPPLRSRTSFEFAVMPTGLSEASEDSNVHSERTQEPTNHSLSSSSSSALPPAWQYLKQTKPPFNRAASMPVPPASADRRALAMVETQSSRTRSSHGPPPREHAGGNEHDLEPLWVSPDGTQHLPEIYYDYLEQLRALVDEFD